MLNSWLRHWAQDRIGAYVRLSAVVILHIPYKTKYSYLVIEILFFIQLSSAHVTLYLILYPNYQHRDPHVSLPIFLTPSLPLPTKPHLSPLLLRLHIAASPYALLSMCPTKDTTTSSCSGASMESD
jgi:hypothetical protein